MANITALPYRILVEIICLTREAHLYRALFWCRPFVAYMNEHIGEKLRVADAITEVMEIDIGFFTYLRPSKLLHGTSQVDIPVGGGGRPHMHQLNCVFGARVSSVCDIGHDRECNICDAHYGTHYLGSTCNHNYWPVKFQPNGPMFDYDTESE